MQLASDWQFMGVRRPRGSLWDRRRGAVLGRAGPDWVGLGRGWAGLGQSWVRARPGRVRAGPVLGRSDAETLTERSV